MSVFSTAELRSRFYPNYASPFSRFNQEVLKLIEEDDFILHAGCGADSSIGFNERASTTIGLDLDPYILNNADLDLGVVGDLDFLPLASGSLDLVVSRWVLEHLRNPMAAITETARVLRPGGRLILLTPNRWHYAGAITSIVPHNLQRLFVKALLRGDPDDVFPTFYRANTVGRLRSLTSEAGLICDRLLMVEGAPMLLSFSPVTFLLGIAYERLVNRVDQLAEFRHAILAVFSKPHVS